MVDSHKLSIQLLTMLSIWLEQIPNMSWEMCKAPIFSNVAGVKIRDCSRIGFSVMNGFGG